MTEWRKIKRSCINCHKDLEVRPIHEGFQIKGCEAMEYRHADGSKECPPLIREARPYSHWGVYKEWRKENQR